MLKKVFMCFVALLTIAAAATGPARAQNSTAYNVTFGGFAQPEMNTTVSVASLPETFAGVGVYDFYPFEVISDYCGEFTGVSVTSGGEGKVSANKPDWNHITITVTGTFEGTATIHVVGANYYENESLSLSAHQDYDQQYKTSLTSRFYTTFLMYQLYKTHKASIH